MTRKLIVAALLLIAIVVILLSCGVFDPYSKLSAKETIVSPGDYTHTTSKITEADGSLKALRRLSAWIT